MMTLVQITVQNYRLQFTQKVEEKNTRNSCCTFSKNLILYFTHLYKQSRTNDSNCILAVISSLNGNVFNSLEILSCNENRLLKNE